MMIGIAVRQFHLADIHQDDIQQRDGDESKDDSSYTLAPMDKITSCPTVRLPPITSAAFMEKCRVSASPITNTGSAHAMLSSVIPTYSDGSTSHLSFCG